MKIIDKTPLHDENGQLSIVGRVQGTLKYGLSWAAELEAQKSVIAQFQRILDKGYVLIRNFTLPNSEIVIPMILLGPGGVYVIHVTTVKGFFEAKGDQWNTVNNGVSQPASINLLSRVSRFARAVQIYLERINVELKSPVEPILIMFDPGAHVESMRPVARVVQSDAVKQFAGSVLQARPVWRLDYAYSLGEIIVDPVLPEQRKAAPAPEQPLSPGDRAQAIFNASNESDADLLGFGFDEEDASAQQPENVSRPPQQQRTPRPASQTTAQKSRFMGLNTQQLVLLGVLFLCECVILIGFGSYIFLNQ
jgi:hypothetical protein